MATRQQLTVWIPVVLAVLFTVGYVEWRTRRSAEASLTREPVDASSRGENTRDSEAEQRAFALAAAANARAQRAEQTVLDVKEHLVQREASGAAEEISAAPTPDEERERQRAEREAFLAELDERVATEPVDHAFRSEKESAITSATATLGAHGVALEKAECASSTCKIRLSHPSHDRLPRGAAMEFLKAVHAPGSALTQLAFNFKYENGATVLYGTTDALGEEAETQQ